MEELRAGESVYLVVAVKNGEGQRLVVVGARYESCEGNICRVDHAGKLLTLPRADLFLRHEDAEVRRFALIAWVKRQAEVDRNRGTLAPLPYPLGPLDHVMLSGNPLRAGEPNVAFSAQSNAWGKQDSPQKALQRLGAIFEDIEHLEALLSLIPHGSEYSKRLVSKYVILELHAAFGVLGRLAKQDVDYGKNDFARLEAALKQLDQQHQFRMVRDKDGLVPISWRRNQAANCSYSLGDT